MVSILLPDDSIIAELQPYQEPSLLKERISEEEKQQNFVLQRLIKADSIIQPILFSMIENIIYSKNSDSFRNLTQKIFEFILAEQFDSNGGACINYFSYFSKLLVKSLQQHTGNPELAKNEVDNCSEDYKKLCKALRSFIESRIKTEFLNEDERIQSIINIIDSIFNYQTTVILKNVGNSINKSHISMIPSSDFHMIVSSKPFSMNKDFDDYHASIKIFVKSESNFQILYSEEDAALLRYIEPNEASLQFMNEFSDAIGSKLCSVLFSIHSLISHDEPSSKKEIVHSSTVPLGMVTLSPNIMKKGSLKEIEYNQKYSEFLTKDQLNLINCENSASLIFLEREILDLLYHLSVEISWHKQLSMHLWKIIFPDLFNIASFICKSPLEFQQDILEPLQKERNYFPLIKLCTLCQHRRNREVVIIHKEHMICKDCLQKKTNSFLGKIHRNVVFRCPISNICTKASMFSLLRNLSNRIRFHQRQVPYPQLGTGLTGSFIGNVSTTLPPNSILNVSRTSISFAKFEERSTALTKLSAKPNDDRFQIIDLEREKKSKMCMNCGRIDFNKILICGEFSNNRTCLFEICEMCIQKQINHSTNKIYTCPKCMASAINEKVQQTLFQSSFFPNNPISSFLIEEEKHMEIVKDTKSFSELSFSFDHETSRFGLPFEDKLIKKHHSQNSLILCPKCLKKIEGNELIFFPCCRYLLCSGCQNKFIFDLSNSSVEGVTLPIPCPSCKTPLANLLVENMVGSKKFEEFSLNTAQQLLIKEGKKKEAYDFKRNIINSITDGIKNFFLNK